MPIYVYECPCGQIIEVTHSITEEPEIECDNCEGMMYRKPSVPQVQFKGKGFYSTDK